MAHLLTLYPLTTCLILSATGIMIGLLGGLLGVGGGIIAVPVLLEVFGSLDVPAQQIMPLSVGTAQASVLVASITAAHAHWQAGTIDGALVRQWLPGLLLGTACGLVLGPFAPAKLLTMAFAIVAGSLGVKMALGPLLVLSRHPLRGPIAQIPPSLVGALASALGVGGGTLSTPTLALFSYPVQRAIGAGALFNVVVALPATIAFLSMTPQTANRPADAVGDVALFCVAALSLPALFVAPMAARWSTRVPIMLLRQGFALCLCAIAVRIVMRP
ncbi:sulfite exporter TauE/SafE family protein [Reyranella sp.]|uniref:sulfite exporter TauE/SafE family protein n=1 Tax=Reyranella sp. TaxID=1929291 RepID=UPI003D0C33EE